MEHILYKTEDADAPDVIRDANGEVVLGLCRICGKAEVELAEPCSPWRPIETAPTMQQILLCNNNAGNRWICIGFVYPDCGPGYATHWMRLPKYPPNSVIC